MGGSITSAISAAQRSLGAFSRSLAVIQDNIANAATPGYARQRVALAPTFVPGGATSQGVEVARVETLRSGLLDLQVSLARQRQAQLEKSNEFFAELEPSSRGELEITDVNRHYAKAGRLAITEVRGWWEDAGKHWQHLAEIGRQIEESGVNKPG